MNIVRLKIYFKNFDWVLFFSILLLVLFGLAVIYSVDLSQGKGELFNFKKQIVWVIIGFIGFTGAALIDYKLWATYSRFLYFLTIILLIAVLIFGKTIRGTTGWFYWAGFNFQPVELAKVVLVIYLARYFSQYAREIDRFKSIILSGLPAAFLIFLILLQPDFGSALILLILWLGMLIVVGVKKYHLFLVILFLTLAFIFSWFFIFKDYQKTRILTFLNPQTDPLGGGYNITQSIIAIGSGKIFGRGLSFGSQSQLKFLPEAQTDFIFSVIAEELGFMGVVLILGFIGILLYRLIRLAKLADNDFGLFLVLGSSIWIFGQIFLNVGMNMGLMPVAGVSLPLVSYGGSSLVTTLLILGIIENLAIKTKL